MTLFSRMGMIIVSGALAVFASGAYCGAKYIEGLHLRTLATVEASHTAGLDDERRLASRKAMGNLLELLRLEGRLAPPKANGREANEAKITSLRLRLSDGLPEGSPYQ